MNEPHEAVMTKLTIATFPQMLESLGIHSMYRVILSVRNWALHCLGFRVLETNLKLICTKYGYISLELTCTKMNKRKPVWIYI